jgi:hypothetical protein
MPHACRHSEDQCLLGAIVVTTNKNALPGFPGRAL